ncbi:MAG: hypothetical protein ACTHMJ_23840 [Thermomicrobiales bacterium]
MQSSEESAAAQPRQQYAAVTVTRSVDRWRLLRLVLGLAGLYYLVTGLWPFLTRALPLHALFSATRLAAGHTFPADAALGLTALTGALLLLAMLRSKPDSLIVGLGAGSAVIYAVLDIYWRPTIGWRVLPDLIAEIVIALVLIVLYAAARLYDRRHGG